MPSDWVTRPLGDVAAIFDGPHATPKKTTSGPVFLGISSLNGGRLELDKSEHLSEDDFIRWTRRVTPEPGDVVFSYETRLGEAALIPNGLRCCLGRRMGLLRPDSGVVEPRFLLYAYLGPQFQETIRERTVHGSTVERILLAEMPRFPLRLPLDMGEQRAIAAALGAIDDKIDLNRRMSETLEAMAETVFREWFLDARPPASIVATRHRVEGFGEVPSGWTSDVIGGLADVVGGSTPSTKEARFWEGGRHFWTTPKDLSSLEWPVLLGSERRITDAGLAQIGSGLLPVGSVLMSSRAPIGYVAIAQVPTAVNQGFIAMKPKPSVPSEFLYLWAKVAQPEILSRANGSTFLEISKANFRPIPLLRPSPRALAAFGDTARPLFARIVACAREVATLTELRNLLLAKLISGELRIKHAEKLVEAAPV